MSDGDSAICLIWDQDGWRRTIAVETLLRLLLALAFLLLRRIAMGAYSRPYGLPPQEFDLKSCTERAKNKAANIKESSEEKIYQHAKDISPAASSAIRQPHANATDSAA